MVAPVFISGRTNHRALKTIPLFSNLNTLLWKKVVEYIFFVNCKLTHCKHEIHRILHRLLQLHDSNKKRLDFHLCTCAAFVQSTPSGLICLTNLQPIQSSFGLGKMSHGIQYSVSIKTSRSRSISMGWSISLPCDLFGQAYMDNLLPILL